MHALIILMIACLISFFILKKAVGPISLTQGNPYSFLCYYVMLFTIAGIFFVVLSNIQINYFGMLTPEAIMLTVYLVSYSLIAFSLGVLLAVIITRSKFKKMYNNVNLDTGSYTKRISMTSTCFSLLLISTLVVIYVYINLPVIPLTKILSSPLEMAQARIMASRGFGGISYIRNILGLTFVPLSSCIIYAVYLVYKTNPLRFAFYFSLLLSILMLSYNLAKAPVILYFLSLLVIYGYVRGYNFKFIKRNVGAIIMIFVSLILMYIYIMGVELQYIFDINNPESLVFRVLLGQVQPLFLHFYVFPENIPYQLGKSNFGFLWTESTEIPARLLMEYVNPWGVQSGIAGVANSYYISEAWANFGFSGVILAPIFFGFIWHIIFLVLLIKPTPIKIGILGFLIIQIAVITHASATRLFYNPEIVVSLMLVAICILIGQVISSIVCKSYRRKSYEYSISNR
ncbi:hypothetical protein J2S74_001847 [Evansella vedderi]|uniref:Oligosaccharide repeat unit polymerase n=1 Tax=Evansella vedderi TaxID=38282 RepID=A0ABT9ZVH9_9BACI|nr:O-antigen polymerase [Evansella vedderi]MDQ0254468.1 hypothetical protein [Evansella vedderi]